MRRIFSLWQTSAADLRVIFGALRHPGRPRWLLPALALLTLFAIDPANLAMPLLGVVDDVVLLPLLVRGLARLVQTALARAHDPRVVAVQ